MLTLVGMVQKGDEEDAEHLLQASNEANEYELQSRHSSDQQVSELQLPDREHRKLHGLLYTSHFLSTWNSRVFEFGAFLFLANLYPQTLLPASIYALARAASAAICSPYIGSYVDRLDRLKLVRLSIGTPTWKLTSRLY